jgi:hypothetical protein
MLSKTSRKLSHCTPNMIYSHHFFRHVRLTCADRNVSDKTTTFTLTVPSDYQIIMLPVTCQHESLLFCYSPSQSTAIRKINGLVQKMAEGVGRPRGCAPSWQVHTNKTRVKPDIPTKSYTCMSTSWLLGNADTAKSCKGEKWVPDALKLGLVS